MAFLRESVKKKLDFDDSALPSSPFSSSSSVSSSASCIWDGGVYAEMVVPKEIELEKVGGLEFKLQIPDVRAATVDRLTVEPEAYTSVTHAVKKMYREGVIDYFYSGISPTLIGMIPCSTCYYFMSETMKKSYCKAKNKQSLSRPELLLVGAFSGLTASSITFPLEVARKRLMVGALRVDARPTLPKPWQKLFSKRVSWVSTEAGLRAPSK